MATQGLAGMLRRGPASSVVRCSDCSRSAWHWPAAMFGKATRVAG